MLARVAAITLCWIAIAHSAQAWDNPALTALLPRIVSSSGLVNYARLVEEEVLLDEAMARFAEQSPESHPELFPNDADALAYWLNAYNTCILAAVADHYPITSVGDVGGGILGRVLRWGDERAAFFIALRFDLGGRSTNLLRLEHFTIARFEEARVHFALNCGSISCPPLRGEPYIGSRLEAQLEDQARRFLAAAHGLIIEDDAIALSMIFSWYRADLLDWMEGRHPELPATIRRLVELWTAPLPDRPIRFAEYDWSLNDAARETAPAGR